MTPKIRALAAVVASAFAPAACEGDTTAPVAPVNDVSFDVAVLAADAALADLDMMTAFSLPGLAAVSSASDRTRERSRTRTFYDEFGVEQEAYDSLLTASIVTTSTATRTRESERLTASSEHRRTIEATGLLGVETERTFDGSGTHTSSGARVTGDEGTRTWDVNGSSTITEVVRAVDRAAQPWPLSGSIRRTVTIVRTGLPDGDIDETRETLLTFNGTQFATLTVDGETFEVDLADRGRGSGVSRPRRGGSTGR